MIRIGLYLGADPYIGGTFQYNQAIIDAVMNLPSSQFQPVVAYSSLTWKKYLDKLPLDQVHIPRSLFSKLIVGIWFYIGLPVQIWREFAKWIDPVSKGLIKSNCDIWVFPSQDNWVYRSPVQAIGVIHDLMHRYERRFPEVSKFGEYRKRERHYKLLCKWARGVLVDSDCGKQQVCESYNVEPNKIHILPYIPPKYITEQNLHSKLNNHYALPEKFIFYPAQFWEHKNHKRLIKAVKKLETKIPDLCLVLVGSKKNAYKSIKKLVKEFRLNERVLFLGYVPDEIMPDLYRQSIAMVMPTFFGPTNIPPLEAFALGCPVAVSNIYGMSKQVGDAALLFNPESENEIADAILKLWTNEKLRGELIKRGLEKTEQWDTAQFNKKFTEIILNVTKGLRVEQQ